MECSLISPALSLLMKHLVTGQRQKAHLGPPVWEIAVHLAVACDVYVGVFFVLSFFPRGVLDEILNLIESVSEVFSSYS